MYDVYISFYVYANMYCNDEFLFPLAPVWYANGMEWNDLLFFLQNNHNNNNNTKREGESMKKSIRNN